MSTSVCRFGLAGRIFGSLLMIPGFLATVGRAQTAPQLLPYTLTAIAGGAKANPAAGSTCPVSGLKSTDAFGDGCLATEVLLAAPRFVTTDNNAVVYFSDTNNGLVRRIDPLTGVISTVAGGAATNPATGATCGTGVSVDSLGDGCPAALVKLSKPVGLAFSPAGDLYFADNGNDDVRKIDHVTGLLSNIAGNSVSTGFPAFGFKASNTSTTGPVNAATGSYLNFPYGIAFDVAGNLHIADEGNQALEVVNLGTTTITLQGFSIVPGAIYKFAGYGSLNTKAYNSGDCPNFTAAATGSRGGCYFSPNTVPSWTDGNLANVSNLDNPYDVAVDAAGNVYFANYFNFNVGRVTAANVISTYAGILNTKGTTLTRGTAGSFGIGNIFDVTLDANADLYVSDGSNAVVWRVDAGTKAMYVVAGGGTGTCATATDAVGDGCPATQALFAKLSGSAATLIPGGAGGLNVDPFGDLLIADSATSVIRKAASGTYFGGVGANQATQNVAVHFAAGDPPAANPFSLTAGSANFALGAFTCPAANSDGTTDCTIAVTATPSTLGPFTGTLAVKSSKGATSNFTLSGTYITSPQTRTTIAFSTGSTCNSTTVSSTAPITLTATVVSTGSPTGTVTFFANGTQIGTPQNVASNGTATLTNTFATPGNYAITAKYSGDANFNGSTSTSTSLTSATPSFSTAIIAAQQSTVSAGQTALYSFTVTQNVFSGTISFSCSGLPAYASCVFSPATLTNTGCSTTSTVALSILTQQATPVKQGMLGGAGNGPWQALGIVPGLMLALWVGVRRRQSSLRFRSTWLAVALVFFAGGLTACGKPAGALATPSGTSNITITATGSSGTPQSFTVPLTVQ